MLVIIKNGTVYFCESFANFSSLSTEGDFIKFPENLRIIRDEKNPRNLILVNAPRRAADVVRYADVFPKRFTPQSIVENGYSALIQCLSPFGLEGEENDLIDYCFAKNGKCYHLRGKGILDEVEEFLPLMRDVHPAVTLYLMNKDKPIDQLIRSIYIGLEQTTGVIQFPVAVINTKNTKNEFIYREEE